MRVSVHAEEALDSHAKSGLLEDLAHDRIFRGLSELDKPPGSGQLPLSGFERATDQHDFSAVKHHRVNDQAGYAADGSGHRDGELQGVLELPFAVVCAPAGWMVAGRQRAQVERYQPRPVGGGVDREGIRE